MLRSRARRLRTLVVAAALVVASLGGIAAPVHAAPPDTPPGQAKKWAVGQPLPRDVVIYDLPPALVVKIGVPPAGYKYVRAGAEPGRRKRRPDVPQTVNRDLEFAGTDLSCKIAAAAPSGRGCLGFALHIALTYSFCSYIRVDFGVS